MRFGGLVIDTVVCLTLAKWGDRVRSVRGLSHSAQTTRRLRVRGLYWLGTQRGGARTIPSKLIQMMFVSGAITSPAPAHRRCNGVGTALPVLVTRLSNPAVSERTTFGMTRLKRPANPKYSSATKGFTLSQITAAGELRAGGRLRGSAGITGQALLRAALKATFRRRCRPVRFTYRIGGRS